MAHSKFFGATNRFPYGKLDKSDEGELQLGITTDRQNGVVILAFGKSVAWLGLPSQQARDLAKILIERANEIDRAKQ